MMAGRPKLPLLEVDPDLGALVPENRRRAALRELDVEVFRVPKGPWSVGGEAANPQHVGVLLVEGVIARDVVVSDTVSTELLGPGDLVRPWSVQEAPSLLQLLIRWDALSESRVALLDRRLGAQFARWPEVNAVLIDRINDRAKRLAITQAISQLNRVDRRLLSLLWHLAERWGRMTPDGVAVPLTLSHRMLGQLIGARRPSVSTAVADLAERDELVRRDDGSWLLKGDPVGLPTKEAQRVIPVRRKIIRQDPTTGGGPVPPDPAAHDPTPAMPKGESGSAGRFASSATVVTGHRELHDTLARLRSEAELSVERATEILSASRRVLAESVAGRERRARDGRSRVNR